MALCLAYLTLQKKCRRKHDLGWVVVISISTPKIWGRWFNPILTEIFQRGWFNHQLVGGWVKYENLIEISKIIDLKQITV